MVESFTSSHDTSLSPRDKKELGRYDHKLSTRGSVPPPKDSSKVPKPEDKDTSAAFFNKSLEFHHKPIGKNRIQDFVKDLLELERKMELENGKKNGQSQLNLAPLGTLGKC